MENHPAPQNQQEHQPNEVPPAPENKMPPVPVDPDARGPVETAGTETEIDGGL